jgi:hypothetical protein
VDNCSNARFPVFHSASKILKGIEAMNIVKFPSDSLTFFILINLHAYFEVFATEPELLPWNGIALEM